MANKRLKDRFKDVFAFLPTPFMLDNCFELNEDGYKKNVKFLINNGVKAGVICAGTGEITSLTTDEIKRASRAALETAGDDLIIVPSLPPNVKRAVEIGEYVQDLGAKAVLVFPPNASEEDIFSYHEFLSNRLNIGFMLFPQKSQPWSIELYEKLTEIENVVALKDEISDVVKFEKIVRRIGDEVVCICMKDHSTSVMQYYYMAGAQGFCGGTISIVPRYELGIHRAAVNKDWDAMKELQKQLLPLCILRARTDSVGLLKTGLDLQGLAGGPVRPPRRDLIDEESEELKNILKKLGVKILL